MLVDKFLLPKGKVYMCGHSLGPMLGSLEGTMQETLKSYSSYGIESWNKSRWIDLPYSLGSQISKLIGAKEEEVLVCDSTVLNLFKVLTAAVNLQKNRSVILSTEDNFPADLYIAQGISSLKQVPREELFDHLDETVAVLMLTHTSYKDSAVLDMKAISECAHKYGILTVWDLSHSIGMVPLQLEEHGADFAVGCTYKYLSGGPGSPAFVYANRKYHHVMKNPIQGWMGHDRPFKFEENYTSSGIRSFQGGTPAILSMKALESSLSLFTVELIDKVYLEANRYSDFLVENLKDIGLNVFTPKSKGGHVAFSHERGYEISRALIHAGFICDYREPGLVRLCVNPLYLSMDEIKECVYQTCLIVEQALYLNPTYQSRQAVT